MVAVRVPESDESSTFKLIGPEVVETDTSARMFPRRSCPELPTRTLVTLVLDPAPVMVTGPPLVEMLTLRSPVLVIETGASDRPIEVAVETSAERALPPPLIAIAFTVLSGLKLVDILLYTPKLPKKVVPGAGLVTTT